jgi:hypothetical protein
MTHRAESEFTRPDRRAGPAFCCAPSHGYAWIGAILEDLMNGTAEGPHVPTMTGNDNQLGSVAAMDPRGQADGGHGNSKEDLDRRLDEALMETFPASDPVSVIVCGGP